MLGVTLQEALGFVSGEEDSEEGEEGRRVLRVCCMRMRYFTVYCLIG